MLDSPQATDLHAWDVLDQEPSHFAQVLRERLARSVKSRDRKRVRVVESAMPIIFPQGCADHCFAISGELVRIAMANSTGDVEVEVARDMEGVRLSINAGVPGAFPLMQEIPNEIRERLRDIGARVRLSAGRSCAELFLRTASPLAAIPAP